MANPATLILLLIAAAAMASASAHMNRGEQCKREIQEMPKWQCMMWVVSEKEARYAANSGPYSEAHLQGCCEQLNRLSSNCRCDAVWEMMMEIPGYGDVACRLGEECGITSCGSCPGGSA